MVFKQEVQDYIFLFSNDTGGEGTWESLEVLMLVSLRITVARRIFPLSHFGNIPTGGIKQNFPKNSKSAINNL